MQANNTSSSFDVSVAEGEVHVIDLNGTYGAVGEMLRAAPKRGSLSRAKDWQAVFVDASTYEAEARRANRVRRSGNYVSNGSGGREGSSKSFTSIVRA